MRVSLSGRLARSAVALLCGVSLSVFADGTPAKADHNGTPSDTVKVQGGMVGRMGAPAAVNPDKFKFSKAETDLWLRNHLSNIKSPTRLYYEFKKTGSYEEGFTDSVYLDIVHVNADGTKDADMQYLSGGRQEPYGPGNVTHITGNPVLMMYLDGDVRDMNRLTHGNWRYFQRRIKLAFANSAKVEPTELKYNGKMVKGEKITIEPYIHDPRAQQLAQFALKRYVFILSDKVPGTIYQIKSIVPAKAGNAKQPLMEKTLTLERVQIRG